MELFADSNVSGLVCWTEIFSRGVYKCTYTTTMAAYFESVTTSPYSQAVKLLKTHQKN